MRYRVISNGDSYRIERHLLFFWYTVIDFMESRILEYPNSEEARKWIDARVLKQEEMRIDRAKKWMVV